MDILMFKAIGKPNYIDIINHCNRDNKRLDVDWSKTHLNKTFGDDVDLEQTINALIKESEERSGKKLNKRTTLLASWCLQAPPEIEGNMDEMNKFFSHAVEYTKKRYAKYGFIVKGYVHYDEIKCEDGKPARSHVHILFIPYGKYQDNKRKNLKKESLRKVDSEKIGFCYGFVFDKKSELTSYQDGIKEYLSLFFDKKLSFGNMDEKEHSKIVKLRKESAKLKNICNQYEEVMTVQKESFFEKYKDNDDILADYENSLSNAILSVGKRSPIKSAFSRIKRFFLKLFPNYKRRIIIDDHREQSDVYQQLTKTNQDSISHE